MGGRVIALVAVGIGLIAASAWAQSGQVVLGTTVYALHDLPSDAITGFTVPCPFGYFAVSAGVSRPGPGTALLSVRPVGLRAFTFRFGNPATNDATRVAVAVACRKTTGGPVFTMKPVKTRVVVKPGGDQVGHAHLFFPDDAGRRCGRPRSETGEVGRLVCRRRAQPADVDGEPARLPVQDREHRRPRP